MIRKDCYKRNQELKESEGMTDIEFIKRAVQDADQYLLLNDVIYYEGCYFTSEEELWNDNLHKRNLLQSAIEGVNRTGNYHIQQDKNCILATDPVTCDFQDFELNHSVMQAKRSALEWVYTQED